MSDSVFTHVMRAGRALNTRSMGAWQVAIGRNDLEARSIMLDI
jgi:hypothetical protein